MCGNKKKGNILEYPKVRGNGENMTQYVIFHHCFVTGKITQTLKSNQLNFRIHS